MKKIFALIILATSFSSSFLLSTQHKKIKMYLFNSPSHDIMRDKWFLPSLQDDYEIIVEEFPQECSGNYKKDNWTKFTQHKIDLILRAIEENWGHYFIYSDVDIQFFAPTQGILENLIGDQDIVIQKDSPENGVCSGFFMCRANERTKAMWKAHKRLMQSNANMNDQRALDRLINHTNPYNIKWILLPDTFFNGGILTGKIWNPGDELELPEGIVLHHANWTTGIENKIAQLTYVKNKVLALANTH